MQPPRKLMTSRRAIRWFDTVRDACDDLGDKAKREAFADAIIDASEYYASVGEPVPTELLIVGLLEGMVTHNTALGYFYNTIHTDALQVRKYLENILSDYEAKKYVWFQTSADGRAMLGTKPTATDLRNHIKADDVVLLLNDCIRLIANCQHQLEDIRDSFTVRGFSLKTITDIRIAKLEEVWVDGTRETTTD
jgi:hypothetical protein